MDIFERLNVLSQKEIVVINRLRAIRTATVRMFCFLACITASIVAFCIFQGVKRSSVIPFLCSLILCIIFIEFIMVAISIKEDATPYLFEKYYGYKWIHPLFENIVTELRSRDNDSISVIINPDTISLQKALNLLKTICSLGGNCSRYLSSAEYTKFKSEVETIAKKLLNYPNFNQYVLISAASTRQVQEVDSEMFERTLDKYLRNVGGMVFSNELCPEDSRFTGYNSQYYYHNHMFSYVMQNLFDDFVKNNTDSIRQMKYNISKWLPIIRQRESVNLEVNFKKWFDEGKFTFENSFNPSECVSQLFEDCAS